MVNQIKLLDRIHLQKYIYLLESFVSNQIEASIFENLFLQIRREDTYWLSGLFDERIGKVLDTFSLDVSDFNSDELFDPNDKFNINENELRKRTKEVLYFLKDIIK